MDKGGGEVALPIVGEAAAFQRDVQGVILACAIKAQGACVGHPCLTGVAGEMNSGAVSAFELLQVGEIAQASCDKSPRSLQMTGIQLIQRPHQVVADQRSGVAPRQQAGDSEGTGGNKKTHFVTLSQCAMLVKMRIFIAVCFKKTKNLLVS